MRVLLNGQGTPIPEIALPDPTTSSDLSSQSFLLTDGVPFLKADYVALGYTHYEVWCVGAVGGRGGNVLGSYGGAGGGGGLHRVAGLLSSLPASCPVVVGAAGADGADGTGQYKWNLLRESIENNWYYWDENPLWAPALPGQDGGASSFDGTTCRASGGKGGSPSKAERRWRDSNPDGTLIRDPIDPEPGPYGFHQYIFDDAVERGPGGNGGQGGSGGRTLSGGGATGGITIQLEMTAGDPPSQFPNGFAYFPPQDGSWDGIVGQGGGGGWGGNFWQDNGGGSVGPDAPTSLTEQAASGGQGSYSFADTTVYGPRQPRSGGRLTIPGTGGGAKVNKLMPYGSNAPGFNPNGAVFIRLTKIV